jgi:hypothetical protein
MDGKCFQFGVVIEAGAGYECCNAIGGSGSTLIGAAALMGLSREMNGNL